MKIGVFDSGMGGLSVARAIERDLPEYEVLFRNDAKHVPYGSKTPEVLLGYVEPILQSLADAGCEVVVVACNTVSTTLIDQLRGRISVPLIAMEPMVKPAAKMTKSGVIAVCATPTTLKSARYAWLKQEYAKDIKVVEPDCRNWSRMIEAKKFDAALVQDEINDAIVLGADVIVLGCTHYHWIQEEIKAIAGSRAQVIQPEPAIIKQLKTVISKLS
ncbi:MAG: putative Glutamate racemase [Candidatus Saccharibacteria bacterium]|nr:putative Glutamate racemase [Candidatus Saccharibacteria bacterium]